MSTQFQFIDQIQDALKTKKASTVEVVKDYLERINKSKLNAFLTVCDDRALAQAKKCDDMISSEGGEAFKKYPLLGVPLGIKDALVIDQVRTTCGSKMLQNYIPPYTATTVERLENAGAISLGKLNMDEFAMGSSNENSAFGPVLHPTHKDRVPGGSSGGSAAAVKADLCIAALGSDTGGSIRLPASFCDVVGLKPTYGRVSRSGLIAFASSLDQVGPLTKSVKDSAYLMDIMAGFDPKDSTSSAVKKTNWVQEIDKQPNWKELKIGIPKEYFGEGLDSSVRQSIEKSLAWFESQGAKLVEISLPHTQYAVATYYLVAVSEASSNLARYDGIHFGYRPKEADEAEDLTQFYQKVRSYFGAEVKRRIILGTFALSSGYYDAYYKRACQVRHLIKIDFDKAFEKVDLIASAVSPTTAFKLGSKTKDPIKMYLNDILTIPASLAGLPAISVPCGKDQEGLSIGLQIIAPHFEEMRLINCAHIFENNYLK